MKRVVILGGTGTLGQALAESIHNIYPDMPIKIIARGEHRIAAMKRKFPKFNYVIGDIRDPHIVKELRDCDVIFHAAALKHVDIAEDNTLECYRTNTTGSINVMDIAAALGVEYFVFCTTDKAVDPINAYGYSKAMAESHLFSLNRRQTKTKFSCYRWGNVLGSQGSVIPEFIRTIKQGHVRITDPEMTRFWIPIDWAVQYMLNTFADAKLDEAMVPPVMHAASVVRIISNLAELLDVPHVEETIIGLRPGEKIHESIYGKWSRHGEVTSKNAQQYSDSELKDLLRPFVGGS